MYYGSGAHAAQVTHGRRAEIADGLQWLTFDHLPEPLRGYAMPFYDAACSMIERVKTDSPELKIALNKLTEAKDACVRAGIRHDTGRAGSVPRPQEVVAPPQLTDPPGVVS